MPKKISKAALEALVTAGKTAPAVEDGENLTPEEAAAAEETARLKAEGEAAEANEGESEGEGEGEAELTPEQVLTAENEELLGKFDASQVELAELTTKLEKSEETVEQIKAAHKDESGPLCKIIEGQINTMRVALSLTSVNMDAFAPQALVTEYNSVRKTFESSLIVGGIVPNEEGETQDDLEARSREDADKEDTLLGF